MTVAVLIAALVLVILVFALLPWRRGDSPGARDGNVYVYNYGGGGSSDGGSDASGGTWDVTCDTRHDGGGGDAGGSCGGGDSGGGSE